MKYFRRNYELPFFKNRVADVYGGNYKDEASSFSNLFIDVDSYFFYIDSMEKTIKLKRNKLRSRTMNAPLSASTQFLKILKKNGLYHRYYLQIVKILLIHRHAFDNVDLNLNELYKNYYTYHLFAKANQQFYNLNFILNFITFSIDPCIQIKVVTPPKFLQKKFKKRFDFQIKHIDSRIRARYVYKRVILNSSYVAHSKMYNRLYSCLASIFLNPRDNLIYSEKIFFYRYALRMHKLGSLKMQEL